MIDERDDVWVFEPSDRVDFCAEPLVPLAIQDSFERIFAFELLALIDNPKYLALASLPQPGAGGPPTSTIQIGHRFVLDPGVRALPVV